MTDSMHVDDKTIDQGPQVQTTLADQCEECEELYISTPQNLVFLTLSVTARKGI
jgi:hypothetical protein